MKNLIDYIQEEIATTPGNTMGMGNPGIDTDPLVSAKPNTQCDKKKKKQLTEGIFDTMDDMLDNPNITFVSPAKVAEWLKRNGWEILVGDRDWADFIEVKDNKVTINRSVSVWQVSNKALIDEEYLDVEIEKVNGNFKIYRCMDLVSLKGAPAVINGKFEIVNSPKLKTLQGGPEKVEDIWLCNVGVTNLVGFPYIDNEKADIAIRDCKKLATVIGLDCEKAMYVSINNCPKLTRIDDLPDEIYTLSLTKLKGLKEFNCGYVNIEMKLNLENCPLITDLKGLPGTVKMIRIYDCGITSLNGISDNYEHVEVVRCEKLKDLTGCPQRLKYFSVANCSSLESLKGCPKKVSTMEVNYCTRISTLDDCPDEVDNCLDISQGLIYKVSCLPKKANQIIFNFETYDYAHDWVKQYNCKCSNIKFRR